MNAQGLENSAILLMSLGEDGAAEVFKHLGPREVQKLGQAMAALKNVTREKMESVLDSFRSEAGEQTMIGGANEEVKHDK